MAKPVVLAIGLSGNVGMATEQTLAVKYARKVEEHATLTKPTC